MFSQMRALASTRRGSAVTSFGRLASLLSLLAFAAHGCGGVLPHPLPAPIRSIRKPTWPVLLIALHSAPTSLSARSSLALGASKTNTSGRRHSHDAPHESDAPVL